MRLWANYLQNAHVKKKMIFHLPVPSWVSKSSNFELMLASQNMVFVCPSSIKTGNIEREKTQIDKSAYNCTGETKQQVRQLLRQPQYTTNIISLLLTISSTPTHPLLPPFLLPFTKDARPTKENHPYVSVTQD